MRKTVTTKKSTIGSREELEQVMGEYAAVMIEQAAVKAEMEEKVRQVREEYEARFASLKESATALITDLGAWAAGHPEAFKERKSLELLHGVIGFRTGTPSVVLRRGVDEDDLVQDLIGDGLDSYVRTRQEIDRQAVLAAVAAPDGEAAAAVLAEYGIKVRQTERFYAEAREEKGVE